MASGRCYRSTPTPEFVKASRDIRGALKQELLAATLTAQQAAQQAQQAAQTATQALAAVQQIYDSMEISLTYDEDGYPCYIDNTENTENT